MVKNFFGGLVLFALIILLISFSSASFIKGNSSYSITKDYGPGENISGWINFSLNNQQSNSTLKSSFGDSINLIDLIKKTSNSGFQYTCIPLICTSNYAATNPELLKNFETEANSTKLFGFKITGQDELLKNLSSFSFDLTSDNPETETFPLSIDLLNDGNIEWNAYNSSHNFGNEYFGCFVGVSTNQLLIASTPQYCEKINLQKTPEVEIGAYLTYVKGTSANYQMKIQKVGSNDYKTCNVTISGSGLQRVACTPAGFKVTEPGDFFVCVSAKNSVDNGKYSIASEQDHPCGFTGSYDQTYNFDFEIFARPAKYSSSISITFNSTELNRAGSYLKGSIESYIKSYISSTYDNNCSNGCVIPVKIYSGINQNIGISNAFISYESDAYTETNDIYDIQETPALLNSGFQKLYLDDAGFKTPDTKGDYNLSVSLDEVNIFSAPITVGGVPVINSITPTTTAVKYPTKFIVSATSENNITQYTWDFGDGITQSTTTNEVTYTYGNVSTYILKVTVSDAGGKSSSKNFEVVVGPASSIVPTLLEKDIKNLITIKNQIAGFSQFEQTSLNKSMNIQVVEQSLSRINDSILEAVSEEDFERILDELLSINVPNSIARTASSDGVLFFPDLNNINLEPIRKIAGGSYSASNEALYKDAVLAWDSSNTNTQLSYDEISAIYDDSETPILRIFNLHITKTGSDTAYIIIKSMSNMSFGADYSQKSADDYIYIDLSEQSKDILLSTTDNVDFVSLPMFISPALSKLSINEVTPIEENQNRWVTFIIIIGTVLAIAIVVWILLQIWYKRRYETFLFKDRNNLFNIITYIENSKKNGMNDKDIIEKLKKTGWNSEQVAYALKKYAGKNTGLPEIIPVGKLLERFKKIIPKKGNLPKKT